MKLRTADQVAYDVAEQRSPGPRATLFGLLAAAWRRGRSPDAYLDFQTVQAELVLEYLRKRGVKIGSKRVLDVGCGHGGYARAFQAAGAEVLGADMFTDRTHHDIVRSVDIIRSDALAIPLSDRAMDLVFCASLIEHVPQPRVLIDELKRVLRPGGVCYLSFPPFYTPLGGHQFKPFHLLGERAALYLYRRLHRNDSNGSPNGFGDAFGEWGLYRRTIGSVRRHVEEGGFRVLDESTRFLPINLSRVPFISEFVTWHVQFLLQRPL